MTGSTCRRWTGRRILLVLLRTALKNRTLQSSGLCNDNQSYTQCTFAGLAEARFRAINVASAVPRAFGTRLERADLLNYSFIVFPEEARLET